METLIVYAEESAKVVVSDLALAFILILLAANFSIWAWIIVILKRLCEK